MISYIIHIKSLYPRHREGGEEGRLDLSYIKNERFVQKSDVLRCNFRNVCYETQKVRLHKKNYRKISSLLGSLPKTGISNYLNNSRYRERIIKFWNPAISSSYQFFQLLILAHLAFFLSCCKFSFISLSAFMLCVSKGRQPYLDFWPFRTGQILWGPLMKYFLLLSSTKNIIFVRNFP